MEAFVEFLFQPQILAVLALVVIFLIGLWGRKWLNIFRVIFQSWHLLEKLGVLTNLAAYEKLALAMNVLKDKFYKEFGREPKPGEEGWAVRFLNLLCKLESKDDVEDFLEPSLEDSGSENSGEETG